MRAFIPLTALAMTSVLAACSTTEENAEPNPFCQSGEGVPGGWQDGVVDERSVQALAFALERIDNFAGLAEIIAVKTQVVSGMNYALEFRLDNDEVWNAIVYSDPQGRMSMNREGREGSLTDGC